MGENEEFVSEERRNSQLREGSDDLLYEGA